MEEKNDADNEKQVISNCFFNKNTLLVISKEEEPLHLYQLDIKKYGEVSHKDLVRLTPDIRVEHNEKKIALFKNKVGCTKIQSCLSI